MSEPAIEGRYMGVVWNAMHEECSKTEVIKLWFDEQYELRAVRATMAEQAARIEQLINLVESHLRREPVIDKEIYTFRNVQGFAVQWKALKQEPK